MPHSCINKSLHFSSDTPLVDDLEQLFGPEGILAKKLPGYETRPGQLAMARSIAQTLLDGFEGPEQYSSKTAISLAVEAGTGIGKTLAYLVPAALSRQKVIISTNTLNLQEQIISKEIPFLKKHIMPDLNAICMKGRQNYLCLYRWHQFTATPQRQLFAEDQEIIKLQNWIEDTTTGDRAELSWLPDDSPLWHTISSSTSQCLGIHCPDAALCFINQLRKKAGRAQLLIVNHHLFFSDLGLRRFGNAEVLPRYEAVIFDEAHHIENIATKYFGNSFSHYQLVDLVQDIEKTAKASLPEKSQQKTIQLARSVASQADHFITIFPQERGRFPLIEFIEESTLWTDEYSALTNQINSLAHHLELLAQTDDSWNGMLRRCEEILVNLSYIIDEQDNSSVYWYEKKERTVALSASPIDITTELKEHLYKETRSVIFTSATLSTGGTFTYFLDRLGLPRETETLTLETPFDYSKKTRLYIPPNHFPEPNHPEFSKKILQQIYEILQASNGRALLLFTSISAMKNAYDYLSDRLDFPLLIQGSAPKSSLLTKFQQETHSVLLAVASFWEGIDVPGQTLSCVIIDKLPFEVPSDPVIMARINKIKEDDGNPFFDFQVPRAILSLRQGVGRLMRSSTDKGLLAIMDVRLFKKSYGKNFLKSLPPSPIIRTMEDVLNFFEEM